MNHTINTVEDAVKNVVNDELHNVVSVISEKSVELDVIRTNLSTAVEENTSLSEKEQLLISQVYNTIKHDIETVLINFDISNHTKMIQMIALIIKSIESITSQKEKIAGSIKKKVALECGRMCIKQIKDNADILIIYDSIAEVTLETMVDVSRNLNVKVISEAATSMVDCCMGFFSRGK
jgi:hypothetical protein